MFAREGYTGAFAFFEYLLILQKMKKNIKDLKLNMASMLFAIDSEQGPTTSERRFTDIAIDKHASYVC